MQIVTKIVETEGYMGIKDKAAHVYNDKKTDRTKPLYLEGGHIYVYLIYGMYHCLNLSANLENIPECVLDRKSTRLNSSHVSISYAVFCLKKKKEIERTE